MASKSSRTGAARTPARGKGARRARGAAARADAAAPREGRLTLTRGDETFTFADRLPLLPLR